MGLFSVIGKAIPGVIGGALSASASKKAVTNANAATQAGLGEARAAIAGQQALASGMYQPYQAAGTSALGAQLDLLGLGGRAATAATPGSVDWTAYVNANPDLAAEYQRQDRFKDPASYGQFHYQTYGQNEGRDLTPYTTAASTGMAGVSAADAQQGAIAGLQNSPLYSALYNNGLDTVLNNASATGGLRGGNATRSLYSLGTDTLSQVIQSQLQNLGGIAGQGLSATNSNVAQGSAAAGNIAGLYNAGGQANAGAILGKQGIDNQLYSGIRQQIQAALAGGVTGGASLGGLGGATASMPSSGFQLGGGYVSPSLGRLY